MQEVEPTVRVIPPPMPAPTPNKPKPRRVIYAGAGYTIRRSFCKIGRNSVCWCGTGKKYKHCHYKKDSRNGML